MSLQKVIGVTTRSRTRRVTGVHDYPKNLEPGKANSFAARGGPELSLRNYFNRKVARKGGNRDANHCFSHAAAPNYEHRRMENAMGESFRDPTE